MNQEQIEILIILKITQRQCTWRSVDVSLATTVFVWTEQTQRRPSLQAPTTLQPLFQLQPSESAPQLPSATQTTNTIFYLDLPDSSE